MFGMTLGLAAAGSILSQAEAPSQDLTAAAAVIREVLEAEWQHIRDDTIRYLAQLPASLPHVSNPLPPSVSISSQAGKPAVLEIVVPVLGGTEASSGLILSIGRAVRHLLEVSGYSFLSVRSSSEGSHWSARRAPSQGGSQGGGLEVVWEARTGELRIQSDGGFNQAELDALLDLVRAANNLTKPADNAPSHPPSRPPTRRINPLDELRRALSFWPSLEEQLEALQQEVRKSGESWDESLGRAQEEWEVESRKVQEQFEDEFRRFMESGIADMLEALGRGSRRGEGEGTEESAANFYEDEVIAGQPQPPTRKRPPSLPAAEAEVGDAWKDDAARAAAKKLEGMGAMVYPPGSKEKIDWGLLAGYEQQKRSLEDLLLLPLQRPDVYDAVARGTRASYQSNRPRALLLDGPPGTGKTTSARILSTQAALPLVYLPLEAVVSKWYGEAEQRLAAVFQAAEALGGCILFIDELDSLATSREGDMHEVSRRMLSVLLREMEGFQGAPRCVVIGATNRRQDLDPALLSRFDATVTFPLPDTRSRQLILKQYAQQLSDEELGQLAARTPGMSGRDLRDVCEITERRWASQIIRGEVQEGALPTVKEYLESAAARASEGGAPSFLSLPNPYANLQQHAPGHQ